MLDLSNMKLPNPESDIEGLDLSSEEGMPSEPKVDLSKVSDDELMAEAEARGLLESEEPAPEDDMPSEDDDLSGLV